MTVELAEASIVTESGFMTEYVPKLKKEVQLYELAKREQWNTDVDVDWDRPVGFDPGMSEEDQLVLRQDFATQLFLGEQGAFGLCGQILNMVPDMEAKLYVGTQIMDEARHVEVFARYANKCGGFTQLNPELEQLLSSFIEAETYEEKIVGMQVFVEGMILEVFKSVYKNTPCPVLRDNLGLIIKDESRHANFGVVYLSKKMKKCSPALRDKVEDSISAWAQQFTRVMHWENPDLPRETAEMRAQNEDSRNEIIVNGIEGLRARLDAIGLHLK